MERPHFPGGKRYNSYAAHVKEEFGFRLQKIVIDAGFTCPNRDGSKGVGGCTFCNNSAFHPNYSTPEKSIREQIEEGIEFHSRRYRNSSHFLAYFQPYTNTYAPLGKLKELYECALEHSSIDGIVIGTRPDCVSDEILDYIEELSRRAIVIVEYGIESCYDRTLARVNRGHDFECAKRTVEATAARGIRQGAHFIFGLPGESRAELLDMAKIINTLPIDSVKFHQLQIIINTPMEREYNADKESFVRFTLEEYLDFFVEFLEYLRPSLLVERFAGEVPPRFVSETPWGMIRNTELLRLLDKKLEEKESWQGKKL